MNKNSVRKKTMIAIERRLQLAPEQELRPYIEMVEMGIQQGILDLENLKRTCRATCVNVVQGVAGDELKTYYMDSLTFEACDQLAKEICQKYFEHDIATMMKVLFMCFGIGELSRLPDTLKMTFGYEVFETCQNQYELDKLVKSDQPDTLSI